jgi:hypothetical protein
MTAGGAALRSTAAVAARGATFVAVITAVAHALEEALESAVAAFVQVSAILAAIGAAGVVAIAIAGIGTWRVALPVAMICFAAGATLIGFAAEHGCVPATAMSATTASAASITIIATAAN